jgi:predicted nucleotidyltransferase
MRREEVLKILEAQRSNLRAEFAVTSLRLFGSVARDEAQAGSDIDILVDFRETPSLFRFLRLRSYLEDLLGARVDLVTETGLKERARKYVEQDAISVA